MKRQMILIALTFFTIITLCGAVSAADNDINDTLGTNVTVNYDASSTEPDPPLTITKGSWDTTGLDSNNVNVGPDQTLVQFHVTNPDPSITATNVVATFTWTSSNSYIKLATGESSTKTIGNILPGETKDVYFLVEITRNSAARLTSRNYTVYIQGTNTPPYSPTGSLYVEKLLSQNRNQVTGIKVSDTSPQVGDYITVTVTSTTSATNYNNLALPLVEYNPAMLVPVGMVTTYTDKNGIVRTTNNIWITNPNANAFTTVWTFYVAANGTSQLYPVMYDNSGSSYHYNGDYGDTIEVYVPAQAGDLVWNDLNADGKYTINEPGVPNVLVSLYTSTGTLVETKTTDAYGNFLFTELYPQSYYLKYTIPSGYIIDPVYGTGYDNKANPTNGQTTTFTLSPGQIDPTWDAGIYLPPTVGGFAWDDQNADGIYQGRGSGISDVLITLYHSNGTPVGTTYTGDDGYYSFTGLLPGDYYVNFTKPGDYEYFSPYSDTTTNKVYNTAGDTHTFTLTSGQTDMTQIAAMYNNGSIGDFVWEDMNANGIWDEYQPDLMEPALAGVTVELYNSLTNVQVGDPITTGTNGYYLFEDITPGDYYVQFYKIDSTWKFSPEFQATEPDQTESTPNRNTGKTPTITLFSGHEEDTWDAGLYQYTTISGKVWDDDLIINGMIDTGEPFIPYVIVNLFNQDGVQLDTTTTDASGNYSFSNAPGTYYLQFITPTTYTITTGMGTDNKADSSGYTSEFTMYSGEPQTDWNAGMIGGTPPADATVGGFVWDDQNADGIYQGRGGGIANVLVTLYQDGTPIGTTYTGDDGYYSFTGLTAGDYYINFTKPDDFEFYSPYDGTTTNKVYNSAGDTHTFTLTTGETDMTWNAAMYNNGSIGDSVWEDMNANGIWDEYQPDLMEPALAGVTVKLYNSITNIQVGSSIITGIDGYYLFDDITPGDYYVLFTKPDNTWKFSPEFQATEPDQTESTPNRDTGKTPTITLFSGHEELNWDAGLYQYTTISGTVWNDLNNNGDIDTGEPPLQYIIVNLFNDSGEQLDTTTTDLDGNYTFSNAPGTYYLQFITPDGYYISTSYGDNTADSSGYTTEFDMYSGEPQNDWDAGMFHYASIGDWVWNDQNADGIFQGRGWGLPNVTVTLCDETGTPLPGRTTMTDADGFYSFDNLLPGTYIVQFTLLDGYTFSPYVDGQATNKVQYPETGQTGEITIESGENNPYIDAAMYQPVNIGGLVWDDLNANGIIDAGEPGLAGVTVELYNDLDELIDNYVTTSSGNYLFENLTPDFYFVKFSNQPIDYVFSPQYVGSDPNIYSYPSTETGETSTIEYTSGTTNTHINAGLDDASTDNIINLTKTGVYEIYCKQILWIITATNEGIEPANIIVTDLIGYDSPNTTFHAYYVNYGSGWIRDGSYNKNTGEWIINGLDQGEIFRLAIYVSADNGSGTYGNTSYYSDLSASAEVYVPDLEIELTKTGTFDGDTGEILWNITATNNGTDGANFSVWDQMGYDSPNTTFLRYYVNYGSGWIQDGSYDGNTGEWLITDLGQGETFELAVYAYPDLGPGLYENTAYAQYQNTAYATVEVEPSLLVVSKSSDSAYLNSEFNINSMEQTETNTNNSIPDTSAPENKTPENYPKNTILTDHEVSYDNTPVYMSDNGVESLLTYTDSYTSDTPKPNPTVATAGMIPMQATGSPLAMLILGLFSIVCGAVCGKLQ